MTELRQTANSGVQPQRASSVNQPVPSPSYDAGSPAPAAALPRASQGVLPRPRHAQRGKAAPSGVAGRHVAHACTQAATSRTRARRHPLPRSVSRSARPRVPPLGANTQRASAVSHPVSVNSLLGGRGAGRRLPQWWRGWVHAPQSGPKPSVTALSYRWPATIACAEHVRGRIARLACAPRSAAISGGPASYTHDGSASDAARWSALSLRALLHECRH